MANIISELSIFFPLWNEEKNIETLVKKTIPIASTIAEKWEIILVDDGSSDNTAKIAKKLIHDNPNVSLISHTPNRGYGAALREGFVHAQYNIVVFTDGDGQFDFSEVTQFIEKIQKSDIVIGVRKKRRDNFMRFVLMSLLKVWDFIFFGFYFRDIDCGFKMFRKEALQKIMPLRCEGAMITTEILAKSIRKKLLIEEVEVNHYPRKYGNQSGGNFAVVIRAILESFILWWDIRNARF